MCLHQSKRSGTSSSYLGEFLGKHLRLAENAETAEQLQLSFNCIQRAFDYPVPIALWANQDNIACPLADLDGPKYLFIIAFSIHFPVLAMSTRIEHGIGKIWACSAGIPIFSRSAVAGKSMTMSNFDAFAESLGSSLLDWTRGWVSIWR